MRQLTKCVVVLAIVSLLLGALSVWQTSSERDEGPRLTLLSDSSDPRLALAVALLDAHLDLVCSGTALTSRWVLTAAHCLLGGSARLAQTPYSLRAVPLVTLYSHPRFSFRSRAEWGVREVRALRADVALCETRAPLLAQCPPALRPRRASPLAPRTPPFMLAYRTLEDLVGISLMMVGYVQHKYSMNRWRREGAAMLSLTPFTGEVCGSRGPWVSPQRLDLVDNTGGPPGSRWEDCVCASAARPVCRGESGAGVFSGKYLVAIASLGPSNCSQHSLSVFTIISPFIKSIKSTIARRSLRYKKKSDIYVNYQSAPMTVMPYIKSIRSKHKRPKYLRNDKKVKDLKHFPDFKFDFKNDTYAYKQSDNISYGFGSYIIRSSGPGPEVTTAQYVDIPIGSGAPTTDSGSSVPGNGLPTPNNGSLAPENGPPAPDSGPPAPDSGPLAPDSDPPAPDSGPLAPDSDPPAPDSGPLAPDNDPPAPDNDPPAPDSGPPGGSILSSAASLARKGTADDDTSDIYVASEHSAKVT